MNERDAEVWRLHRQGMSVRPIARELRHARVERAALSAAGAEA